MRCSRYTARVAILAALLMLVGSPARAQSTILNQEPPVRSDPGWANGTHSLGLDLGVASAVGLIGLSYSYIPVMPLEMEAAVGYGITGAQCSLMQKVVLGSGPRRTMFGAGVSYSPRYRDAGAANRSIWWLNLDLLGLEWRAVTRSPAMMSVALGITVVLDEGLHWSWGDCGGKPCSTARIAPQFRFIVGSWR